MFRRTKIRVMLLAVYLGAIAGVYLYAPAGLILLGFPWSIPVVMLGWLVIHAGSGSALNWAILLSTLPNLVLLLRWILSGYARDSVTID